MNPRNVNVRAEKLDWIAAQLRGLLAVTDEEDPSGLFHHISMAYLVSYRSAAEIYESETVISETVQIALEPDIHE